MDTNFLCVFYGVKFMLEEPILKKKIKNKKNYGILTMILLLITLIGGVYAFFTYQEDGNTKSQLVSGDIYMKYKGTNGLEL